MTTQNQIQTAENSEPVFVKRSEEISRAFGDGTRVELIHQDDQFHIYKVRGVHSYYNEYLQNYKLYSVFCRHGETQYMFEVIP